LRSEPQKAKGPAKSPGYDFPESLKVICAKDGRENPLAMAVSRLPGVSKKLVESLAKYQIVSLFDLLLHAPKSVVEQSHCPGFLHMENGRHYVVEGKVVGRKITGSLQKKRLEAVLQDETGRLAVVFFGPAVNYAQLVLKEEAIVKLSGEAKNFLGRMQMVHPKIITAREAHNLDILPTYSQIAGIKSANFKKIVDKALLQIKQFEPTEHLGESVGKSSRLAPLYQSLVAIHEIGSNHGAWDDRHKNPYFRRLAFEEILSFYLRLNFERGQDKRKPAHAIKKIDVLELAKDVLPFILTSAQTRAANEILDDLKKTTAMTRLLQGDVGSGKTAVSAMATLHTAMAGLQVAVMAPTEILAEQLFQVYSEFFRKKSVKIALLTASTKPKEKAKLYAELHGQEIDIVVGTHALLSDKLRFRKLGLIVVDEQHRFGVKQRSDLISSCARYQDVSPHLLVMSATPIPRSLALTVYGDLDLSIIDERPKGRLPVHTQVITGPVLKTLEKLCERIRVTKQKAFIVFPLVEESEHLDLENASKAFSFIEDKFGQGAAMLLHGKMKAEEKAFAMAQFRDHGISFLVSTTVVEVGVDIPDATCMVIMHPERFGLAQLHQLRGRVGRRDLPSFCFLLTDITNKFGSAYQRLSAMCKTDNGFKLAEIDLAIRGPGELLGVKQSGLPNFTIFSHSDFADLIEPAKKYAQTIAKTGPKSEHHHLFLGKATHFC